MVLYHDKPSWDAATSPATQSPDPSDENEKSEGKAKGPGTNPVMKEEAAKKKNKKKAAESEWPEEEEEGSHSDLLA